MRDTYVLLDQHLEKCGFVDLTEGQRLLAESSAVQHVGKRGPQKRTLRLTRSLASFVGGEPPRLLSRGWAAGSRFVAKEMVNCGNGRKPVYHPVAPQSL